MISGIAQFRKIYDRLNKGTTDIFLYHFGQQFAGIDCRGKKILDLGCGKGFTALALASLSPDTQVTAIDEYEGSGAERENYHFFRTLLDEEDVTNVQLFKMDFYHNNFPDETFDIVVANHSLHHIVRETGFIFTDKKSELAWTSLLHEIKRVMKNGGVMIAKEMTRTSIWRYLPLRGRGIEWEIHPTKRELSYVLKNIFPAGISFKNVVNYRLRGLSGILKQNPIFTFLVTPDFYFKAPK